MSRDITIDFVRIIACIAVVLMHVVSVFWYPIPVKLDTIINSYAEINNYLCAKNISALLGSYQWYILSFCDAITRFSVPIFIMVSGALVLKKKEISIEYGFNKSFYIFKIIFIWGGILTVLLFLINHLIGERQSLLFYAQTLINGGGVFWFLYMLMPLYLSAVVYKAIVKDKNAMIMFLFLWFIMTVILSSLKYYCPGLDNNIKLEYMSQFSLYSGYFVLGYALYRIKSDKSEVFGLSLKTLRNISCVMVVLMLVIMTFGKPVTFFHNFSSPICVILSTSIYWILINVNVRTNGLITKYASSTLGIYAIHMLYIKLFTLFIDLESFIWKDFLLIYIIGIWIAVIFCSYVTVAILKIIPVIKNI